MFEFVHYGQRVTFTPCRFYKDNCLSLTVPKVTHVNCFCECRLLKKYTDLPLMPIHRRSAPSPKLRYVPHLKILLSNPKCTRFSDVTL